MDADMPVLKPLGVVRMDTAVPSCTVVDTSSDEQPLWDDPSVQAFYESLPDIIAIIPNLMLAHRKEDDAVDADVADVPVETRISDDPAAPQAAAGGLLTNAHVFCIYLCPVLCPGPS